MTKLMHSFFFTALIMGLSFSTKAGNENKETAYSKNQQAKGQNVHKKDNKRSNFKKTNHTNTASILNEGSTINLPVISSDMRK